MEKKNYNERGNDLKFNSSIYQNYISFLSSGPKTKKTIDQYKSKIIIFLEHFNFLEIKQISEEQIIEYIHSLENKKGNTNKLTIFALKSFLNWCNQEELTNININVLDELVKKEQKKPKRKSQPLTISEIINIREITKKEGKYTNLFTFEMFLTYGLSLDEIVNCYGDTYFPEKFEFLFDRSKKPIVLSKILRSLIGEHPDLLVKRDRFWYEGKNKETGKIIGRANGLVLGDIFETRELYFPMCPICKKRFPNNDEFWVLVEYENDSQKSKWLYCRSCVEKDLREERLSDEY